MTEFCDHGFSDPRRCPRCGTGSSEAPTEGRRSVYEDRPVVEVVDEEWRAEQLRSIGIGYGWRPVDEFVRGRQ